MPILPLSMIAGEDRQFRFTVVDVDGEPVNLTGATIEFQAKAVPATDEDSPVVIEKTVGTGISILLQAGASIGKFDVTLDSADTAELGDVRLYYDVVIVASSVRRYVVPPSPLTIKPSVNPP